MLSATVIFQEFAEKHGPKAEHAITKCDTFYAAQYETKRSIIQYQIAKEAYSLAGLGELPEDVDIGDQLPAIFAAPVQNFTGRMSSALEKDPNIVGKKAAGGYTRCSHDTKMSLA